MNVSVLQKPISLAFGPEFPGDGSWNWVGRDLAEEFGSGNHFETSSFRESIPDCDGLLFVKYLPEMSILRELAQRSAILFFPIDVYGSGAEIDADWNLLRHFDRVLLHTSFLEKYVRGYARTELVDHYLKFAAPLRAEFVDAGPLLWNGVWLILLLAFAEWVKAHGLHKAERVLSGSHDEEYPDRLRQRKDFEDWVMSEPRDGYPEYLRSIGWQSQKELTAAMIAADVLFLKAHDKFYSSAAMLHLPTGSEF